VVPDGVGILLAAKYKGEPLQERISGYDLMLDLLAYAEKEGLTCYFLGATDSVNEQAVREAVKKFPQLQIAGRHHGFFDLEDLEVARQVKQADPDIIFVATGLPKQE